MGTPAKLQSKLAYVHVIKDGLVDRLSTTSFADGQKETLVSTKQTKMMTMDVLS